MDDLIYCDEYKEFTDEDFYRMAERLAYRGSPLFIPIVPKHTYWILQKVMSQGRRRRQRLARRHRQMPRGL